MVFKFLNSRQHSIESKAAGADDLMQTLVHLLLNTNVEGFKEDI
jgi:hypothetical protein